MISLDSCLNVTLDGFVIETDDQQRKRNPAGIGILVDGSQFGGSCVFRRLRHVTYPGALDLEATFIAVALVAKNNQEFHQILECAGNGNGRGTFVRFGPSYNTKANLISGSKYVDSYQRAVVVEGGYVDLVRNNMSRNEWDLWLVAGPGAVGFVSETYHIGEASTHHAFVNMPFTAFGQGTYDQSWSRPRSELLTNPRGYPDGSPEALRPVENAWILFGPDCPIATIRDITLGTMRQGQDENTKVFGFMDAGAFGRVDLGPFNLGPHHTMRTLGLDEDTLAQVRGAWNIKFHNRATDDNPGGPGVLDLPNGEWEWNGRGVRRARADGIPVLPTQIEVGDGPTPWDRIARGQTVFYRPAPAVKDNVMFRHVDTDGRRKQGVLGSES